MMDLRSSRRKSQPSKRAVAEAIKTVEATVVDVATTTDTRTTTEDAVAGTTEEKAERAVAEAVVIEARGEVSTRNETERIEEAIIIVIEIQIDKIEIMVTSKIEPEMMTMYRKELINNDLGDGVEVTV